MSSIEHIYAVRYVAGGFLTTFTPTQLCDRMGWFIDVRSLKTFPTRAAAEEIAGDGVLGEPAEVIEMVKGSREHLALELRAQKDRGKVCAEPPPNQNAASENIEHELALWAALETEAA